ncbi:MAG: cell division protein FtsH, partial [Eubacteriales bacterium]|nr:cell division protein FtsH [Eubacteriales bacterium]
AILTARYHKKEITMEELEEAITRVVVGPEKKSRVITEQDKKITAYHESGHAIVALHLEKCDPVHEVSIIPRGMAGGYTMTLPKEDMMHTTKAKLLDNIAMMLGGRVAEELTLGDISTGAYNDLQRATDTARKMVVEYGMSDAVGPVFLGGQTEGFIAKDWGHQRNFSEEVASKIDGEIRRILDEQYERARECIKTDMTALDRVAHALLEYERIDGEEFEKLYKGEDVTITPKTYHVPQDSSSHEKPAEEAPAKDFEEIDIEKELHKDEQPNEE